MVGCRVFGGFDEWSLANENCIFAAKEKRYSTKAPVNTVNTPTHTCYKAYGQFRSRISTQTSEILATRCLFSHPKPGLLSAHLQRAMSNSISLPSCIHSTEKTRRGEWMGYHTTMVLVSHLMYFVLFASDFWNPWSFTREVICKKNDVFEVLSVGLQTGF